MALPVRNRDRALGTWDPISEMERTARRMSQLFDQAPELFETPEDAFSPLADLEETDDAYVLEIELPGVKKNDIDIQSRGRRITVSGERKEKERVGVLRKRTRSTGRFFHEVALPGDIDDEGIEASLDNGVLTLRVPKEESEQQRTRHIEIR